MPDNARQLRISEVGKGARLLFFLLLLELALLFFQHVISSAISRERITLGQINESLAVQLEECAFRSDQLKIYETEETKLKQKLPKRIDSAAKALIQTRETLDTLKIAGEVKEKTGHKQGVILETVCEGTYTDLTALLGSLREGKHAVRLGRLTVEALGAGRLCFTADIEYSLHAVLQDYRCEDV